MAKVTREQRREAVIDAIGALGGSPDLETLEQELTNRGQRDYMRELMPMKHERLVELSGRNEGDKIVTRVSVVA